MKIGWVVDVSVVWFWVAMGRLGRWFWVWGCLWVRGNLDF